jgi:hypothetical protein
MSSRAIAYLALAIAGLLAAMAPAQAEYQYGPFARISMLKPHDSQIYDWEEGYLRHLQWHKNNQETWNWYGYNLWSSAHQRYFVYASFGHSAHDLSNPIDPVADERDTRVNIIPYVEFLDNMLFEFLPRASDGNGIPTPLPRTEFTTVDVKPGMEARFEAALYAARPRLQSETLWYRLLTGANVPRYVRLRPKKDLEALLDDRAGAPLPLGTANLIDSEKVEVLSFRPTMSLNISDPKVAAQSAPPSHPCPEGHVVC